MSKGISFKKKGNGRKAGVKSFTKPQVHNHNIRTERFRNRRGRQRRRKDSLAQEGRDEKN